jgi:SAM-dependent methyltransferase
MPQIVNSPIFWGLYFRIYDRLATMRTNQHLLRECVRYLNVRRGGIYLDLGCGTGNSTLEIARAGGRVQGLDLSTEGLRRAQNKVPGANFMRANLDRGLPLGADSLDGVLAVNALYLSADPENVFAEVFRVLKPEGRFVLSNPRRGAQLSKILLEDLELEWKHLKAKYGRAVGAIGEAAQAGIRVADFMAFLPFQLALKGGSPHFEYVEFWRSSALKAGFNIKRCDPSLYGGQNDTLVLVRPLR